jgi:signal transduction histidine kinase
VEVFLQKINDRPAVVIKDTGIGISEGDLPYVFERLYRDDKSRNKIEGNGLGLSITKKILEYHKASVTVESTVGKGSVFRVIFQAKA